MAARTFSSYNAHVAGLTEEQNEFRTAVARFADEELAPRAHDIDRDNAFPMVRGIATQPTLVLRAKEEDNNNKRQEEGRGEYHVTDWTKKGSTDNGQHGRKATTIIKYRIGYMQIHNQSRQRKAKQLILVGPDMEVVNRAKYNQLETRPLFSGALWINKFYSHGQSAQNEMKLWQGKTSSKQVAGKEPNANQFNLGHGLNYRTCGRSLVIWVFSVSLSPPSTVVSVLDTWITPLPWRSSPVPRALWP